MAIEAKVSLLNRMERTLKDVLTVNQMTQVLGSFANELANFDVEQTHSEDPNDSDLLDAFLSAKQIEGRTDKTLERYRYIITRFMNSVGVCTRDITVFHLRRYLAEQKKRGIADSTLEGIREIFSSYFGWLFKERLIEVNPCINLCAIKCPKVVKQTYTEVDIDKIKSNCKNIRDKAIVCFLLSTGCRISEMTSLNIEDVDLHDRQCKVLGKGNKERVVYMDAVTAMALKEYLQQRKDNEPALFIGKGTTRLTPHGVRFMLHSLQVDADIQTVVHPHRFRRTLATHLIHRGMPIQEVARILGHEKLDTTMEYVCLNDDDIRYAYNKYM